MAKLKLYLSVIRPVVTYACETQTLKETISYRLMIFERKILRKMFGPTNENSIWRIETNQELDKIIKPKNIINFIRAQRLGWLGPIERKQEIRMFKTIHSWKPISRRPIGRPQIRSEDDVRKDIQKLKVPNWKTLVQDRRRWKELVEKAKTLHRELQSHTKKKTLIRYTSVHILTVLLFFHCSRHLQVVVIKNNLKVPASAVVGCAVRDVSKGLEVSEELEDKAATEIHWLYSKCRETHTHPTTQNPNPEDLKPTNNLVTLYFRSDFELWCMNSLRMAQMCRNTYEQ